MINGIIILADGSVQQIGELTTVRAMINTMRQLIPQLEQQERDIILKGLSEEDLERIIAERRKKE